jgi:hypothetical protein
MTGKMDWKKKETAMTYPNVSSQHLFEGTKEYQERSRT